MIGYNVREIKNLMESMQNKGKEIKGAIEEGWPLATSVLSSEWVGPDEHSYETKLADRMIDLYSNEATGIRTNLNKYIDNIAIIGQSWIEFQKGNILEGAASTNSAFVELIGSEYYVPSDSPTCTVTGEVDYNTVNLGLTNGAASAGKITEAIKNYVTEIENKIKSLFSEMESSKAFLGETQSAKINEYINTMGVNLGATATLVKDLEEAMQTLTTRNYQQSESNVAESAAQQANQDYDFSNSLTHGGN